MSADFDLDGKPPSRLLPGMPMSISETTAWWTRYLTRMTQEGGEDGHERAMQWLGRNDLFFLLTQLLGRKDLGHPWLFQRIREVQGYPDGYLDLWFREGGKSSVITFGLTIQDILNDPEVTFGVFSHTRDIAKGFLVLIKREFEGNEQLKSLYPEVLWGNPKKEAPRWSDDDGIIVKRKGNPKESTVEAWGLVDGQPTGKHFLKRIYDDVVTLSSVATPEQIRKTTLAWEMSDNLGARGGAVRYIGTRYAMFDTYSAMLERGIVTPRIYAATDNGRLDGNPVLFTPEQWEEKKRTQRSVIAAQMLQNPLSGDDQTFDVAWLLAYETRPRLMNVVILCDPSKGRSAKSDRTAIAVIGIAGGGTKYLLDGFCHRMSLSERWIAIRDLHRKWSRSAGCNVIGVGYERYGMQSDDEYFMERMRVERYSFPLMELNWTNDSNQSKGSRIERLEPDFRLGRFYLPYPVYRVGIGSATWRVENGALVYRRFRDMTTAQRQALDRGERDLLARAIKRADESDEVYDVTVRLIEEFSDHPYGRFDDMLDATSRVYDMSVSPPRAAQAGDMPKEYWDS